MDNSNFIGSLIPQGNNSTIGNFLNPFSKGYINELILSNGLNKLNYYGDSSHDMTPLSIRAGQNNYYYGQGEPLSIYAGDTATGTSTTSAYKGGDLNLYTGANSAVSTTSAAGYPAINLYASNTSNSSWSTGTIPTDYTKSISVSAEKINLNITSYTVSIIPNGNNIHSLGTSSSKWNNIYSTTFTGDLVGNAATASTLATSRTIQTNLASTTAVSFNGSANITPGVTGILPVANGGTGASALSNIIVGKATADASGNTITTSYASALSSTSGTTSGESLLLKSKSGDTLSTVILDNASDTISGIVTTSGQSFTGLKTFTSGLYITESKPISLRNSSDYYTNLRYDTGGNEAIVLSTRNNITSFIFKSGDTGTTQISGTSWQSLTPTFQAKGQSFYINSLIANGITPSYNFYVNGTSYLNGTATINGTLTATTFSGALTGNASTASAFNSSRTIALTGNITGSVSSNGSSGWSIPTTIGSSVVTNNMLAGSIANAKLSNSSLTIGTTSISLGGSSTTLAGLTSVTSTSFTGALTGNVTGNVSGSSSSCTGNATTATKLGTATVGSASVPIFISTGTATACTSLSLNTSGSSASCTGNASTASVFNSARTIALTGNVTGSVSSDGTSGWSIPTTIGSGVVTNAMLSGGIENSKLSSSSITIGSTAVPLGGSITVLTGISSINASGSITGSAVYNAVFNDIVDCIEVKNQLLYGRCYYFNGKDYLLTTKKCQKGTMGIHSDTAGFEVGNKGNVNQFKVSIGGFVLAYIDKDYKCGTPLTSSKNGILTKMTLLQRLLHPERIVGIFWKEEPNKYWGTRERQIEVNGRKWVKIK